MLVGPEIRNDLAEIGVDLDEYIDGFRLRALYELIMGRPQNCKWREALMHNDQWLDSVMERELEKRRSNKGSNEEEDDESPTPRMSEYTLTHSMLNRLIILTSILASANGVDVPEELSSFPTPDNPLLDAMEAVDQQEQDEEVEEKLAFLLRQALNP